MTSWRKMIISAALLILTSAAFDLLVVDFWLPVFCDQASSEKIRRPATIVFAAVPTLS